MLKKILVGGTVAILGGMTAYVINEMRKEWDKMVSDYNDLADFINKCDFYEYRDGSAKSEGDQKHRFKTETQEVKNGGSCTVLRDKVSGFRVYSYERA